MIISRDDFVEIIKRLKGTNDTIIKVNDIFNSSIDSKVSDYINAASLMICHEDIVVDILQKMFNDEDTISWWLYDLDYGTKYTDGCITESNGTIIDLSTAEKLYDYLVENMAKEG